MKPIILAALAALALAPRVLAQAPALSAAPAIEIRLDKAEYAALEPVLVTVAVTNESGGAQPFGAVHPIGAMRYAITGPDGDVLPLHPLFQDVIYTPLDVYAPGERRTVTFDLLRYFPASVAAGSYELEVQYSPANGPASAPVTAAYTVALGSEVGVLDSLRRAAESVWTLEGWSPASAFVPEPTLEAVSGDPSVPDHLRELASYLLVLSAEIDLAFGFGTDDAVAARRATFLEQYPSSVYAFTAEFGYAAALATDGADMPSVDPFESLTGAVVVVDAVDASFNGTAFSVSGAAVDLSGVPVADYDPVHGLATSEAASATSVENALSDRQAPLVTGLGPAPDVVEAALPFDAAAWAADLAAQATVTLDARPSGPVGTEASPVVAHAPSGVRLGGGFRGVGVLVVDGAFEMRGDAEWRGLVVVRGSSDQQADPTITGSTRILGALLVLPGEGGGPASLRLAGGVSVLYSPEALALARAATEQ